VNKAEKLQHELESLLQQKLSLEAKINHTWQQLRMHRIAAIRGGQGASLEPLPQLGLDELARQGQEKAERLALEHYAIDSSPEYRKALANINAENAAA
jgi:hypothetical protein